MVAEIPKFDIREGVFILGNNQDELLECGVNPNDVYELGALLLNAAGVKIESAMFPSDDYKDWERKDYEVYAKWLHSVLVSVDPDIPTPTEKVYERAYYLGIGPEPRRITRRYGPLWKFHDGLEFKGGYCRGKFDDWSKRDFIEYGKRIVDAIHGKKPTEEAFQRWFENGRGPSPALIRRRIGGIGIFQELLGFPFIRNWEEDEYVSYGTKVALANPGRRLTRDVFDELSKRKRGPSTRSIVNHFGKLGDFQETVYQKAEELEREERDRIKVKNNEIERMFELGIFPEELEGTVRECDDKSRIQRCAVFLLVNSIFGEDLPTNEKIKLSGVSSKNLIRGIRSRKPSIGAGEIEIRAVQLDIFDDIWPMDDYLQDLRI